MNRIRRFGALALGLVLCGVPVRADTPPGQYSIGTDTVLDRRTGLEWQRGHTLASFTPATASAHCDALVLAGKSDWRLPTIRELSTLISYDRIMPAIDLVAFPDTPRGIFLSSTPPADIGTVARWAVNFDYGLLEERSTGTPLGVRCVR